MKELEDMRNDELFTIVVAGIQILRDNDRKKGYAEGYADGKANTPFTDTEYEQGLNESWECARKMCLMSSEERLRVFDVSGNHLAILSDLTAPKAIAKLKAFEQKQKCKECKKTKDPIFYGYCNGKCDYGEKQTEDIKVGDEVTHNGATFIVLNIDSPTSVYCLDTRGRTPIFTNIHNLTKTGRHFDAISEVLKQMNREEDK